MTGAARFAKPRSGVRSRQHALRRLDVHALDHLVAEALGAATEEIENERTEDLLDAMQTRPTRRGDVWFVPPGTPHAIGAGVFILEVQEPTDFSIVLETRDVPIDPADAHLRLGWDVMLDSIDAGAVTDDALGALHGSWLDRSGSVLPPAAAQFFWVESLAVDDADAPDLSPTFAVGVVTAGRGVVRTESGELPIRSGEAFAIPAAGVAGCRCGTATRSSRRTSTRSPCSASMCW